MDNILKNYTPSEDRDCIILFLTDGYPNQNVPNQESYFKYLKNEYPYIVVNGVQYEMGQDILSPIKKVSDNQYIADINTLNNVLFDASVVPIPYDSFILTDDIDIDNFTIESMNDIKVSQGSVDFNKEEQKVTWTIEYLRTGAKPKMTIDVVLKEESKSKTLVSTNKKEEVNSSIHNTFENIVSDKTPILKGNYKVIYEENAPDGCIVSNIPNTRNYKVFDQVEIEKEIPKCEGYQFRSWKIISNDVKRINADYFEMPENDVVLRAEWTALSLSKSMDGEVYESTSPVLQKIGTNSYNQELWKYKSSITKVVFQNSINNISGAIESFDISEEKNGRVIGYIVQNTDGTSTYTAYIQGDGEIIANQDSSFLFYYFYRLKEIVGLEYFNTSNAKNMSSMFAECQAVKGLNLSNFNTSSVTDMNRMFMDCSSLENLSLSSFDTSKVTDMNYMFYNCADFVSINLSNFDTSNVKNMRAMFASCDNLTSLNLSNFNTSNVTDMKSMFSGCSNLTRLDISNFDTSNVTDMGDIFYYCNGLTSLNVSHFNTSSVKDMSRMFYECWRLANLDVSNFNTSNVINMDSIFYNCSGLTSLDVSHFDTSRVTNMSKMFYNCGKLTILDVKDFNTSNVTNMGYMFFGCSGLTSLDISNFDTSEVINMERMFNSCNKLTATINIYNPGVTNYGYMFALAANKDGAQIIVNYIESTSDLVDQMIETKTSNSDVVKGNQIPEYNITITGNDNIISDVPKSIPKKKVSLLSTSGDYVVKSFKVNGVLVNGNQFIMQESDVTITDIEVVTATIIESTHNPYPTGLYYEVYGEQTFNGATSLTVVLDYQTKDIDYDWFCLYDSTGREYGKYGGGTTKKSKTITIPGNYIKIIFKTSYGSNNHYGFKAFIVANYD